MKNLQKLVLNWATEKGILENPNPLKQAIKTSEEVLELQCAILDNNEKEIKDAIGDIIVTLIIQCEMHYVDFLKCYIDAGKSQSEYSLILNIFTFSLVLESRVNTMKYHIRDSKFSKYLVTSIISHIQIISIHFGFDPKECLQLAYSEIKDRKGKMINGTFVKD